MKQGDRKGRKKTVNYERRIQEKEGDNLNREIRQGKKGTREMRKGMEETEEERR